MEQYAESLLRRYRNTGVLVDTNMLLLYFVGAYDPQQIIRFRRTRDRFVQEDFDTLKLVLGQFEIVVTTPHVLTEVSNLLGQLSGQLREGCFGLLARSIARMREQNTSGVSLSESPAFIKFGITDAAILDAALGKHLVLTDDFRLAGYLGSRGVDVLNFNNIRTLGY